MKVPSTRREWLLNAWASALLCVALVVAGNRLARSHFQFRVDLSEDQLYAPSPVGRRLLGELEDVLSVRAYFTARSRLGPVQIAKGRLIDQLEEFEEAAGGRMELSFVDPNDSAEARAEALELGIQPVPMRAVQGTTQVTQDTWLGLCMRYRGRELVVPFVQPQSFEYSFLTSLQKLWRSEDPVIGFVTGEGRGDEDEFRDARALLQGQYRLREVLDLAIGEPVPEEVSVLVVARPRELHPRAAFEIDQFLQRGGHALLLCDPFEVELSQGTVRSYPSGLEPLLAAWGLRLSDGLVWDQRYPNAIRGRKSLTLEGREQQARTESLPYPFWPQVNRDGLDAENPVTARIDRADFFWVHGIEGGEKSADVAYEELVSSSEESWIVPPEQALNVDGEWVEAQAFALAARGGGAARPLAVSLAGKLASAFVEGAPEAMDPVEEALFQTEVDRALAEGRTPPEREILTSDEAVLSGENDTQIVLFGDADWIRDGEFSSPRNKLLFVNLIDWLALEKDLIALRSRLPLERRIEDFLRQEREELGLLGLVRGAGGRDADARELVELETRAQERAARRRHLLMAFATGGSLLVGVLLYGVWWLATRRRAVRA